MSRLTEMRVVESQEKWQGMAVRRFDFLLTPDANPTDLGFGNVRVLLSARKGCSPSVKWVWTGTKRRGFATAAYGWLVQKFGMPLTVVGVSGHESIEFHRRMKKRG